MTKVFIYDDTNHGKKSAVFASSAEDLRTLFQTHDIVTKPDISMSDWNFNAKGLDSGTIFVIPGGQTFAMGCDLGSKWTAIQRNVVTPQVLAVCAGAFLGAAHASFFNVKDRSDKYGQIDGLPVFLASSLDSSIFDPNISLNLVTNYSAMGPFYPTGILEETDYSLRKKTTPYKVTLHTNTISFPQLYVEGPAFECIGQDNNPVEVISNYGCSKGFHFLYPKRAHSNRVSIFPKMPAMLSSKHTQDKGGFFLSGTHFEAGVKDSQTLKAFQNETDVHRALPQADYQALQAAGDSFLSEIVPVLKKTFMSPNL